MARLVIPHSDAAARIMDRALSGLARLREQAIWRRAARSVATCSGKDASASADAIDVACGVIGSYMKEFPRGEHALEAEHAVALGHARAASLRVDAEKAAREKCLGVCRTQCAAASVHHFDDCFQGCLELGCSSPGGPSR